ncbi:MAG: NUDIX hydrolase [Oscillospiraceae bacterium]
MHLDEKTIASEELFQGKILRLTRDTVLLENGQTAFREVIHHSGGVCVVPLTEDEEVIFVKQYRYPFKTTLLEIPAGKLEAGEDPETCGRRELREEAGAVSGDFCSLGKLYPTVAYDTEIIYMFLARELEFLPQALDEDEFIDLLRIPLEEAYRMVMENEIFDAKTQIALMKAYNQLKNGN